MPDSRRVKSIGGLLHPGPDSDYGRPGRSEWLDVDWQRHQHRIRIDGREVNYVDIGEGPVLVFVHGLGASWQSWLENMPEFARDHRVVAMDLPGFGYSEMPGEDISIECYASWTGKLLDALGIDVGRGGGQLDGRLHRRRDGDPHARARAAPRRRLRRGLLAGPTGARSRWCGSRGCPTRTSPAR